MEWGVSLLIFSTIIYYGRIFLFCLQVLGIEKPKKEDDPSNSFRPRSSSSKFYKNIFPEKPVTKKKNEDLSNDKSSDENISVSTPNGKCRLDMKFYSWEPI